MKQFNLEEYLKNPSRKVVTRDGRSARIICTDVRGEYPVVAAIKHYDDNFDSVYTYTKDGIYHPGEKTVDDLFFVTEKHEGWVNIFREINGGCYVGYSRIFNSKEKAEEKGKSYCSYVATVKIEWEE